MIRALWPVWSNYFAILWEMNRRYVVRNFKKLSYRKMYVFLLPFLPSLPCVLLIVNDLLMKNTLIFHFSFLFSHFLRNVFFKSLTRITPAQYHYRNLLMPFINSPDNRLMIKYVFYLRFMILMVSFCQTDRQTTRQVWLLLL